jgi:hypothetical protein
VESGGEVGVGNSVAGVHSSLIGGGEVLWPQLSRKVYICKLQKRNNFFFHLENLNQFQEKSCTKNVGNVPLETLMMKTFELIVPLFSNI